MLRIMEEKETTSTIARLIVPKTGQLIIICKNFIFKNAVSEKLEDSSQSRSYSGDHKEQDYELSQPVELNKEASLKTLNVVVTGDTKKALQVLINANLISIKTYRDTAYAIDCALDYARDYVEPEPMTPTP